MKKAYITSIIAALALTLISNLNANVYRGRKINRSDRRIAKDDYERLSRRHPDDGNYLTGKRWWDTDSYNGNSYNCSGGRCR